MKTILLEGTELSGKTTLAKSVRQKLTNEGFNIVINSILHQLVEFHITLYPQVLIDTMKIFINRPNVMNSFIQTMMSQIK